MTRSASSHLANRISFQRRRLLIAAPVALALLAVACSSDKASSPLPDRTTAAGGGSSSAGTTRDGAGGDDPAAPTGDLADCPPGFGDSPPGAGSHDGFASAGQDRAFHLLLPDELTEPAPLFVSLTGTVQEEVAFMAQSGIDQLPGLGWIVAAPVRNNNGVIWPPWDAMRAPASTPADAPADPDPNPDTTLILDLVACLSAHYPVDSDRVFAGGVSIGGTMVNYLLRHHPEVFAGGIVGSGNFILTEPPEPKPLDHMTVIVVWGGDGDRWTGCPDGRMGEQYADEPGCVSVEFVSDAHDAARFYAEEGARMLACHEDVGHIWISHATEWWAAILAESPRGTSEPLDPGEPPSPLKCSTSPPEPPAG